MKTVFKTAMIGIGLILILLTVGGVISTVQGGRVAEGAVRDALKEAFAAPISWDDMHVDFGDRALVVSGLRIMNPEAFGEGEAITCEEVRIQVEPSSLLSTSPRITNLNLRGLDVQVQHTIGSGVNIGSWLSAPAASTASTTEGEDAGEEEGAKRGLIVENIEVEEAHLAAASSLLPSRSAEIEVAPFTVEDVDPNEVQTPSELRATILRALTKEALAKEAPAAMARALEELLK